MDMCDQADVQAIKASATVRAVRTAPKRIGEAVGHWVRLMPAAVLGDGGESLTAAMRELGQVTAMIKFWQ